MLKKLFAFFDRILDRIFSVIGAVAFSQVPEFIQQYIQRLGGHVDEAQYQVELIRKAAASSGHTLSTFIELFIPHTDPSVVQQGQLIQRTIERARELAEALQAIKDASILTRPFVFLAEIKYPIAKATLEDFQPAVPLTLESLIYAFIGLFLVLAFYQFLLKLPIRLIERKRAPLVAVTGGPNKS
jgi:uncharacterized protein (DUF1778 family)